MEFKAVVRTIKNAEKYTDKVLKAARLQRVEKDDKKPIVSDVFDLFALTTFLTADVIALIWVFTHWL